MRPVCRASQGKALADSGGLERPLADVRGHPQRGMFDRLDAYVTQLSKLESQADLTGTLEQISKEMRFGFFALTHHTDIRRAPQPAIRLDNYPPEWVAYFDEQGLGPCDPVHRACHVTSVGFAWSQLPRMIPLTARDREVLALAGGSGLGDGFTIPAHVPGEANGSCSFAVPAGCAMPAQYLPLAQVVGAFAFEAARKLWRVRSVTAVPRPLTDRQRDCVLWAARGKSDWEIACILGISDQTVSQHLKQARERYGVSNRTMLAVGALFDGSISFTDVLAR